MLTSRKSYCAIHDVSRPGLIVGVVKLDAHDEGGAAVCEIAVTTLATA